MLLQKIPSLLTLLLKTEYKSNITFQSRDNLPGKHRTKKLEYQDLNNQSATFLP